MKSSPFDQQGPYDGFDGFLTNRVCLAVAKWPCRACNLDFQRENEPCLMGSNGVWWDVYLYISISILLFLLLLLLLYNIALLIVISISVVGITIYYYQNHYLLLLWLLKFIISKWSPTICDMVLSEHVGKKNLPHQEKNGFPDRHGHTARVHTRLENGIRWMAFGGHGSK